MFKRCLKTFLFNCVSCDWRHIVVPYCYGLFVRGGHYKCLLTFDILDVTDMCRKMARTGDCSSDDSDSEVAGRWHRPLPSDDECDDAIMLKSHQLRSRQRDSNIVLNIRVMTAVVMINSKVLREYKPLPTLISKAIKMRRQKPLNYNICQITVI